MSITENLGEVELESEDDHQSTGGYSVISSVTQSQSQGAKTVSSGSSSSKGRSSWVWQYFDKNARMMRADGTEGRPCPITGCKAVLKIGSSPIGLERHLGTHGITKDGDHRTHHQQSMTSFLSNKPAIVSYGQKDFRHAITDFVVSAALPYTIVENKALQKMINIAAYAPHLNMKLPSATTITRDIKDRFQVSKSQVKSILAQQHYLAYTADAWTSPWKMPILGITAHWIDEDWQYRSIPIGFELIEGSHTGENLANAFLAVLSDWGIQDKPFYLTMDNAKNMDAMANHMGLFLPEDIFNAKENRIPCVAHILNLAAQAILTEELKAPAVDTEVDTSSALATRDGDSDVDHCTFQGDGTHGMLLYNQAYLMFDHILFSIITYHVYNI